MKTTIAAISTPPGAGGIAIIRLSGPEALYIADKAWKGSALTEVASHTAHLGTLSDPDGNPIDRCVATVFRGPASFTGENTVEFSVHGSRWIQRKALEALIAFGAVAASPGEFTQRAFINGKIDLAQAEAVADLIASSSRAAHKIALRQMDGSFSRRLDSLREQIIELASLLELELDFSEEEVEFADRQKLRDLTDTTLNHITRLAATYAAGRAFKEGVPVVIAGAPNAGKSTLLNALLATDKAIVSDIPGTTRDIVEDTVEIDGILFRFIDTAGLRHTDDRIEALGIQRAQEAMTKASIILWLIDPTTPIDAQLDIISQNIDTLNAPDTHLILIRTKADLTPVSDVSAGAGPDTTSTPYNSHINNIPHMPATADNLIISSETGQGLQQLKELLVTRATAQHDPQNELIITNARHHAELLSAAEALERVRDSLATGLSADFIAQDIREAIHHLGLLTGSITTSDLLSTIFSRFCIGK